MNAFNPACFESKILVSVKFGKISLFTEFNLKKPSSVFFKHNFFRFLSVASIDH